VDQLPKKLIDRPDYNGYLAQAERKGYSGVALWSKVKPEKVSYE